MRHSVTATRASLRDRPRLTVPARAAAISSGHDGRWPVRSRPAHTAGGRQCPRNGRRAGEPGEPGYAAAVIESPSLPGDPTELHLRISYDDELRDTRRATRWSSGTSPSCTAGERMTARRARRRAGRRVRRRMSLSGR